MSKQRYFWLFDAGHGGVINGVPQTAGKRSPEWDKGILYEGVSNRIIRKKVRDLCEEAGFCCWNVDNSNIDVSLSTRVHSINNFASSSFLKCIVISFHSDAFTNEKASGWSAYTSKGETDSDKVAEIMYKYAKKAKFKLREDFSDGDSDKQADFYILRKTICPAVLVENFFMTNKKDYDFLMSENGQNKIAKVIFNSIKHIEENGI